MSAREVFEAWAAQSVQVAEVVALSGGGATALLVDPARRDVPAREARTLVDLQSSHIGAQVVVLFEAADPARPIVLGVLRDAAVRPEGIPVEADGERIVVSAQHQLVLRCGKASITLTRAGKVLIDGSYVLSRSSGVNRIKGGSVQLN